LKRWRRGAAAEALELAEIFGATVYGSSWPSCVPVPTAHELWAGHLPTRADEIAGVLGQYDAVFALGGKSLITILYSEEPAIPEGLGVYQLSADVRDLGRTYATQLSVVGDIQKSLAALLPLLRAEMTEEAAAAYANVRCEARDAKRKRRAEIEMHVAGITPLVAARETLRAIGPKTAIVDEAIVTLKHVWSLLKSDWPEQYSFLRGGALGWGMPAAVGCSLGLGREPVVCLVGDGAALYSPQAMWTAAHEGLPVTFVVMNNREYNVLKNFMKSRTDYRSAQTGKYIAMDIENPAIDYLALAQSMGLSARRVTKAADIAGAVEAGIASGAANLVEIMISTNGRA
jgi:benzoylformate decarboxylase